MIKCFIYELKKNLLPIIVFTALSCLVYLVAIISSDFITTPYSHMDGTQVLPRADNCLIWIPAIILCVLCTVVPVMTYSFKTNRRCADAFFSLPIKREKLYLAKSLVGLCTVLIPYIISYWLGFIATVCKENMFNLSAFVPIFFISIPLAVCLFGVNAFAYTRANKPFDGIIFMAFFACSAAIVGLFILFTVERVSSANNYYFLWFTYSPIIQSFTKSSEAILNSSYRITFDSAWLTYLLAAVTGVGAWCGLFATIDRDKAENAEQVSSSIFGYKFFIPFYLVLSLAILEFTFNFMLVVLILIIGIIAYIIYRRSFKLTLIDWCTLIAAVILGIIISLIISAFEPRYIMECLTFRLSA